MNTELHDKAWKLLEEKGLTLSERMIVRSDFASAYKDDYPNIAIEWNKGEVEYYHSTIDMIKSFRFDTEKEVILANAIYENMNEITGINEFIQILKFAFRIIGVDSKWNN
jgi:hypothetical protein